MAKEKFGYDLKTHPAAELMPTLPPQQLETLTADIKKNGLIDPIVTHYGQILDGRHRHQVCCEMDFVFSEDDFFEIDLEAMGMTANEYVWSVNGERRHLSPSQRALAYFTLMGKELEGKAKDRQSRKSPNSVLATLPEQKRNARDEVAKAAKVSPRLIQDAKTVSADPAKAEKVRKGEQTVSAAAAEIRGKGKPAKPSQTPPKASTTSNVTKRVNGGEYVLLEWVSQWTMQENRRIPWLTELLSEMTDTELFVVADLVETEKERREEAKSSAGKD